MICPTKGLERKRVYTVVLCTNTTRLSVPDMLRRKSLLVLSWEGREYNFRALGGRAVIKEGKIFLS